MNIGISQGSKLEEAQYHRLTSALSYTLHPCPRRQRRRPHVNCVILGDRLPPTPPPIFSYFGFFSSIIVGVEMGKQNCEELEILKKSLHTTFQLRLDVMLGKKINIMAKQQASC